MKTCRVMLMAAMLLSASGCIFLPIPHIRLHEYGVKSRLIDDQTGEPIDDAGIISLADDHKVVTSDINGEFILPPVYGWHGAMVIGVVSAGLLLLSSSLPRHVYRCAGLLHAAKGYFVDAA